MMIGWRRVKGGAQGDLALGLAGVSAVQGEGEAVIPVKCVFLMKGQSVCGFSHKTEMQ